MNSRSSGPAPLSYKMFVLILFTLISLAVTPTAFSQTETILYDFCSQSTCSDGSVPYAGVVMDRNGNLYGTTRYGGNNNGGTVFRLKPDGSLRILHLFVNDGTDGFAPNGGVVLDEKGNLYGTTSAGGSHGYGTVFKIASDGTETILYNFGSQAGDAVNPSSGLLLDRRGNLYGATLFGGASGYYGAVFKLAPDGTEKVLYSFAGYGARDGANPSGTLIMDHHGNLYGTTQQGGANGYGTVYKLHADGTEIILHSFNFDGTDGYYPYAGLVLDSAGNLCGTTYKGGANNAGIVFELDAAGSESVLYSFGASSTDGIFPEAGLVRDAQGNLYGTTVDGGANGSNFGTVFKLNPGGTETILHSFTEDGTDGYQPYGTLVMDAAGNLYGTTSAGGTGAANTGGAGTVFRITP